LTPAAPLPTGPPRGVTGPIGPELLRLAVPIFISYLLRTAYQWVDALWVRGLGVEATAAVTTSVFVMWMMISLHDVFGLGVSAYVSQLLGAGDRQRAGLAAWMGLRVAALVGLLGTIAGLFYARPIYAWLGGDAKVVELGGEYLSIVLAGSPILMASFTCESIMRAAGDTRTPLFVDLFAVSLNAVLDPLLIYGWGPFPAMGIAGAAWATVIAQSVMLGIFLTLAARGTPALPFARRAPGPRIRFLGFARVGVPGALIGILFSVVYMSFSRAAAEYGPAAMAVVGIVNRIEALQFIASIAFGLAGASLVGQNLGAGRPDRAVRAVITGNVWNLWISLAVSAVFLIVPEFFIGLFSRDPEVLRLGVPYLRVMALCLATVGLEIVTAESIMGSGHTLAISVIYTTFSVIRIPLAFVVPKWGDSGVVGIAWLVTITCVLRAALIVGWAMRGTWKTGLGKDMRGSAPVPAPGGG
jgi:putative MATE family efflux protein